MKAEVAPSLPLSLVFHIKRVAAMGGCLVSSALIGSNVFAMVVNWSSGGGLMSPGERAEVAAGHHHRQA